MAEQMIGNNRCYASSRYSHTQIDWLFGRYIYHHQICNEKDHRTSQVSGEHQNSYVKPRYDRGLYHLFEGDIPP